MKTIFLSAHILGVAIQSKTLPVIGTPESALIFALLFTVAILILYLGVEYLPRPRKNRITVKNEPTFVKAMIVIVSGIITSLCWDIWWHQVVGRDSLLIPPHIFLYSFIFAGIVLSFYVWRHCRDILWKHVTFFLALIVVSTPFDNFWHTIFGVENYSSPVKLAWAPPHALLAISLAATLVLLQVILLRYRKTNDFSFFGSLALGGINAVVLGLLFPFNPTEGWGQVAGFAGAGVWAVAYISIAFLSQFTMRGRIDATLMTIFSLMFMMITYSKDIAPGIQLLPHDRPPIWLFIFAFLVTAVLLDLTRDRFQLWVRGMFAGIVWSGILFGFSTSFFLPKFQYGMIEIFTTITFSAIGGLVVGSLFSLFHLTDEKHIEKLLKKF